MIKTYLLFGLVFFAHYAFSQNEDCDCVTARDSLFPNKPKFTFSFSNNQSIMLCGWFEPDQIDTAFSASGYVVRECKSQTFLISYDEMITTEVDWKKDTLFIYEESSYLDCRSKKWQRFKYRKRVFYLKDGVVFHEFVPCFKSENLSEEYKNQALRDLEVYQNVKRYEDISELIGKLQFLAMNGSRLASGRLQIMEEYYHVHTNAASKQHWEAAKSELLFIGK